jgi:ParB-like chromosome segregation protein Spo0J
VSQPLPISANVNADLLRALDAPEHPTEPAALAEALGRPAKHMGRTLDRLAEDALIDRATLDLTPAGRRARQGLDLAEGLIEADVSKVPLRHADLTPNPDNLRTSADPAAIASLADTMIDEGQPLQDLVCTTPDANGVRLILIGERRWRAWGLLIERGDWPADKALMVRQRPDRPGLIEELSLIENGQRADLTELERARGYMRLAMKRNLDAPGIHRATRDELRTVQQGLQVMRKATPENIARHEAWLANPKTAEKFTWEMLRESVQETKPKPSLDLSPKLALVLVEFAHAVQSRADGPGDAIPIDKPPPGGEWSTLRDRQLIEPVFRGDGLMRAQLCAPVFPWLAEIGFEDDPDAALRKARDTVIGALQASAVPDGEYLTAWLNVADGPAPDASSLTDQIVHANQLNGGEAKAEALVEAFSAGAKIEVSGDATEDAATAPDDHETDDGGVALYQQLAAKSPAPAPAPKPAGAAVPPIDETANPLNPREALIMIEVAHKLGREFVATGRGFDGVEVGQYNRDSVVQDIIIKHRMLGFLPGPKKHMACYVTAKGSAWLAQYGQVDLATARAAADKVPPNEGYATDWLNVAYEPAPAEPPAKPQAAPEPPPAADAFADQLRRASAEDEPEDREAALVLDQVKDLTTPTPAVLRSLFAAAGLELPLVVEEAEPAVGISNASILDGSRTARIDCNPDIDIPDALGEARARLIAMAVNAACGVGEG